MALLLWLAIHIGLYSVSSPGAVNQGSCLLHEGLFTWLVGFTCNVVAGFHEGSLYKDKSQCVWTNPAMLKSVTCLSLESV